MIITINLLFTAVIFSQKNGTHAVELGTVDWLRNFDEAIVESSNKDKDVLILFQEVPGCSTCRNYGQDVLSHPLMVDAIENLFIPLAIHNNKGGEDKKILEKYNEPTWNNPVVRIVNANGIDIVDRVNRNYSSLGLLMAMISALKSSKKEVPEYLKILEQELLAESKNIEEKTYSMCCFWSGEKHLGKLDGVVGTEAGFEGGKEVVKVLFDPNVLSESDLTEHAATAKCSPLNTKGKFQFSEKDTKYQLQHSNFKYLPLSELQRTKINSALGSGEDAKKYLSPTQLKWFYKLPELSNHRKELYKCNLKEAWYLMLEIAG